MSTKLFSLCYSMAKIEGEELSTPLLRTSYAFGWTFMKRLMFHRRFNVISCTSLLSALKYPLKIMYS